MLQLSTVGQTNRNKNTKLYTEQFTQVSIIKLSFVIIIIKFKSKD